MIVDSPNLLIFSLVAVALLGAIVGYCIALLRAKKQAKLAIDSVREPLTTELAARDVDLKTTRLLVGELRHSLTQSQEQSKATLQRERILDSRSQTLAQRIQTLASQLEAQKALNSRLNNGSTRYQQNATKPLQNDGVKTDTAPADTIPVLNKNGKASAGVTRLRSVVSTGQSFETGKPNISVLNDRLLSDMEIPALSESELADLEEELDADLTQLDITGSWPSG